MLKNPPSCQTTRLLSANSTARVHRCSCGRIAVTVGHTTQHFTPDAFGGLADAVDFAMRALAHGPSAGVRFGQAPGEA